MFKNHTEIFWFARWGGVQGCAPWFVYNVFITFFLPVLLSPLFCNSISLSFLGSVFSPLCVILVGLPVMWSHVFHDRNGHRRPNSIVRHVHHFPGHGDWSSLSLSSWSVKGQSESLYRIALDAGRKRVLFPAVAACRWCWQPSLSSHGGSLPGSEMTMEGRKAEDEEREEPVHMALHLDLLKAVSPFGCPFPWVNKYCLV